LEIMSLPVNDEVFYQCNKILTTLDPVDVLHSTLILRKEFLQFQIVF